MAGLMETPSANRIRIAFFGLRNAGKSTLVNAFTNQNIAIVSDVAGTTTDPVSKAMEILPLGPCLITDTAGLDDVGELGAMRVEKTLSVLETTDVAVWVHGSDEAEHPSDEAYRRVAEACARRKIAFLEYRRGESVEELKRRIADLNLVDETPGLLEGLVGPDDRVVCVCPIDESAPKGRLILPQVQVIRDCLDRHVACTVCQVSELADGLASALTQVRGRVLVITDSQAFQAVEAVCAAAVGPVALTSFSILFARQKGDLRTLCEGADAIDRLADGDVVLISEGCTHHRQCGDIGTVKLPAWLKRATGRNLRFRFSSGGAFPLEEQPRPALVIHCGGCMLTRRAVLDRLSRCAAAGIPVVNYGVAIARLHGIVADPETCLVRRRP